MPKVLIQPTISNFESFYEYAVKNSFAFEIIDFAYPDVLDSSYKTIIEQYKAKNVNPEQYFSMHGAVFDLYINSPDAAIRKVSEDRINHNLAIAQELGIKYVIFHTNALPMIGQTAYYQHWADSHIAFWTKTLEKYNLTILLENMWDKTPQWLTKVIHTVNSPSLRVCFDTGHCNVFSTSPLGDWFKTLGKDIIYIHLNDNNGGRDEELPPGEGNIDWKTFDKLVKKYCSNPHVVLEVANLEMVERSVKYLKRNNIYPF